ncbi:hypothetical protein DSO57_1022316 [Entomophthora muscae]|uniref:Uncharacterized protein n=1 Tax=Entomophthora muscae TaxID=34485 RepID=A0ACC2SFX6_9FUNG|nr:hypothetical protein DSO57_1022316 [Entomophthora muscae]
MTIVLEMIVSCDYSLKGILGAVRLHDVSYKFGSPIRDKTFGLPKVDHNFFANGAGDGGGGMVSGCCRDLRRGTESQQEILTLGLDLY